MLQRSGKGFPEMPFALNVIYSAALVIFSPLLFYRWIRAGKYREGWSEKFLGQGPVAHRRPALPLVSRGQRGRGLALAALGARNGPPSSQLAGRDLDHDHHGPGGRPPDLSRPGDLLRPARL